MFAVYLFGGIIATAVFVWAIVVITVNLCAKAHRVICRVMNETW